MTVLTENPIKWALLFAMAATIPVLYFMFVIAGLLPLIAVAYLFVSHGVWGSKLFTALHLLVYGSVFYWMATTLARHIAKQSTRLKALSLVGILLILVTVSMSPIYGLGHGEFQSVNLYRLLGSGRL